MMGLAVVYRSLKICLFALALIIIAGTVYGLFFMGAPGDKKPIPAASGAGVKGAGTIEQVFTGIGRVRIPAGINPNDSESRPGTVILYVTFPYYPGDKAFTEELALRVRDFRDIISNYIGSFSITELQKTSEESIKAELLRKFNAVLRLGQIETLYFIDFMIIG